MLWCDFPLFEHSLQWDGELLAQVREADAFPGIARDLLARAQTEPLSSTQQKDLKAFIASEKADSVWMTQALDGVRSTFVPFLTKNPAVCTVLMKKLASAFDISDHLQMLLGAPLTIHSFNVVTVLAVDGKLSEDFVAQIISKGIHSCDSISDIATRNRQVRIVCVFVASLLQDLPYPLGGIVFELREFCLRNGHVQEASDLYRRLSAVVPSGGGPISSSVPPGAPPNA